MGWKEIRPLSHKKKTQIIEKEVIEDSVSSLEAMFISFKGLETSKIQELESKGDWL